MDTTQKSPVRFEFNEAKFEELILLICEKSVDDPTFDEEKLNWLLFHIDMLSYVQTGQPVTGAEYIHEEDPPGFDRTPVSALLPAA